MYRRPRLIPCLTMQHYDLVKTMNFKKPRYLGDPINSVKIFNNKDVDEMCILDITATRENRQPDVDYLHEIASEAFMPLGYGGGIRTLQQAKEIFRIGYEKVILNSLLFDNPDEVKRIVDFAGSQSVVASIDYKRELLGRISVITHDGEVKIKGVLSDIVRNIIKLGVGELLLTSIDHEGEMHGCDIAIIKSIGYVDVPIIMNGGIGSVTDIKNALDAGADAVGISSFFVFYGSNKAVLINTPSEDDYYRIGIFED